MARSDPCGVRFLLVLGTLRYGRDMRTMATRLGVVGYGVVGRAKRTLFPDAVIYDVAPNSPSDRQAVNECDISFVCVPTPPLPDGSCDISSVEEVVSWLGTPIIVIHSTIPPGTTEELGRRHGKNLVFQPEYLGGTASHPLADLRARDFVILGGDPEATSRVAAAYSEVYHSSLRFFFTDSRTAELAKYMENAFYATKVLFCSEFRRIAQVLGVRYDRLREIWLADPRISRDHTFAYSDDPGFGGKCLPKDLSAIIECLERHGHAPELLTAVRDINARLRQGAE